MQITKEAPGVQGNAEQVKDKDSVQMSVETCPQ